MIIDGLNIDKSQAAISSFLMIGQSNMAGRGEFNDVEVIHNENCFMLRNGRWQTMSEPINPDRAIFGIELHSGVSLAASFADLYSKYYNKKTGLIPCADGGTKILQWMPGEVLYDNAVFMTRLAMRSSDFKGILWHQGENDCNEADIGKYKERFLKMIENLRKDLNAYNLPVIIGEVSENITARWSKGDYPIKLNKILKELADETPYCRLVEAKELELKADGIHFNSKSLRELGRRYFEAYLAITKENQGDNLC